MAEDADGGEKTEQATAKRKQEAVEQGDVLQSRELGTALVILAGAGWLAIAGPWMVDALEQMLKSALSFDGRDVREFDPSGAAFKMLADVALPLGALFLLTIIAAIATPALLGSLGFRANAMAFKASKLNPLSGLKRIFGPQGWVELLKSLAKIALLGAVGWWILAGNKLSILTLGTQDMAGAFAELGSIFVLGVLGMALALAVIAGIDVPAQLFQRAKRLRMTKQQIKEEHKQTEGSPEVKMALRRKQHQMMKSGARQAVSEATVVLVNPTEFAVALRYRPGFDAAPLVVARGRGATAGAIRELAEENSVPILRYPQLARAIYFTARTGQVIREDLYLAVATVIAFVFNLDAAMAEGTPQPNVEVPAGARFDEDGKETD